MTKIAVRRPVTTFMVILIFVAFGLMSLLNLQMDLLPNMNIPIAVVYTSYVGASPDQIQKLVTEPIEGAMATIDGLDTLTSISSENVSFVIIQFDQSVDINFAAIDMREAVDLVKSRLPEDAGTPTVMKMDINSMSAIYISAASQTDDLVALKTKVDDQIAPRLTRQAGVASVNVSGGREKEIRVDVIEDRIRGYGISESQISSLLKAENSSMPVGSITEAAKNLTIKVDGEFTSLEEIENLPITTAYGAVVYLRDVAEIYETYREVSSYSYLNGEPSVTMSIQKQSTANTVNVSNSVMKELDRIIAEYPELEIKVILDPADYITMSLSSVTNTAISGMILAMIVLFVFLRNIRTTLVVGTAIPLSIMVTFTFMYFANMTMNLMSLGGLVLGVGMLVDNSIVVLESIFRRMELGESRARSAINGATEVAMSIIASTLTTVAVFVPVAWVGGMIAQVFNDLALSISFALAASLLVSLTFVPLACSLFLSPAMKLEKEHYVAAFFGSLAEKSVKRCRNIVTGVPKTILRILSRPKYIVLYPFKLLLLIPYIAIVIPLLLIGLVLNLLFIIVGFPLSKIIAPVEKILMKVFGRLMDLLGRGIDALERGYRRSLKFGTTHKAVVLLVALAFFVGTMYSVRYVGTELLPATDQSQIDISVSLPTGAVLERTHAITEQVLERLEGIPEIKDVSTSVGGSSLMGGGSNSSSITVALTNMKDRSKTSIQLADEIRASMTDIAGAEITVEALTSMMGTGSVTSGDIQYYLKGDDIDVLVDTANDLAALMATVPGIRDAGNNVGDTTPQATIKVDRQRASGFGLSSQTVMGIVNTSVSGGTATTFKQNADEIDVVVGQPDSKIQSLTDLENLLIPTMTGSPVPLREVADISISYSPLSINRENQFTYVAVYASLTDGTDLGTAARQVTNTIDSEFIFPQGVTLESSGSQLTMDEELANLMIAFVIAFFIVYAIMAAEFESLYYPLIIMTAVPLAMSAGVFGLFVSGQSIGITAALGFIMLLGIVINNGIVLIDYINLERGKGRDMLEAVQEAGPIRLRAILMATLTTVLGLVPMMLGTQEGSEMMQPLATVVVCGLALSTLVTLYVVPVVYICFEKIRIRLFGERKKFRKIEEI